MYIWFNIIFRHKQHQNNGRSNLEDIENICTLVKNNLYNHEFKVISANKQFYILQNSNIASSKLKSYALWIIISYINNIKPCLLYTPNHFRFSLFGENIFFIYYLFCLSFLFSLPITLINVNMQQVILFYFKIATI